MLHGLGWEFLVGTWPVPVKTGFDQNIEHFAARWKPVPKACAHKEHLNPAAVARQGLNRCWIWKSNPNTWAHPAVLAAPPQGFLLPQRSGRLLRLSFLYGQAMRAGRSFLGFVVSFLASSFGAGSRWSLWDFQVSPALHQVPSPLPGCHGTHRAHRAMSNPSEFPFGIPLHAACGPDVPRMP